MTEIESIVKLSVMNGNSFNSQTVRDKKTSVYEYSYFPVDIVLFRIVYPYIHLNGYGNEQPDRRRKLR
jgi:hypothetical protein